MFTVGEKKNDIHMAQLIKLIIIALAPFQRGIPWKNLKFGRSDVKIAFQAILSEKGKGSAMKG